MDLVSLRCEGGIFLLLRSIHNASDVEDDVAVSYVLFTSLAVASKKIYGSPAVLLEDTLFEKMVRHAAGMIYFHRRIPSLQNC